MWLTQYLFSIHEVGYIDKAGVEHSLPCYLYKNNNSKTPTSCTGIYFQRIWHSISFLECFFKDVNCLKLKTGYKPQCDRNDTTLIYLNIGKYLT